MTVRVKSQGENISPTASFTVTPDSGLVTTVFAFDASASSDAEDGADQLKFSWDFDGDGTYEITDSSAATASYTYSTIGTKSIILRVKDSADSTGIDSTTVVVKANAPPTASFTVTPDTGFTNTAFAFDASASADAEDATSGNLTYSWNFGDGTGSITDTTVATASYTYADSGTYTITLTVKDTGDSTGVKIP